VQQPLLLTRATQLNRDSLGKQTLPLLSPLDWPWID
jgi:hypothetical protein